MKRLNNKSIIIIIAATCLCAVMFTVISISSSYRLNNNMLIQKEHPLTVSESIYKIRGYNALNQIRINRLIMYNTETDITIVRTALEELQGNVKENLEIVSDRYLGLSEDSELLKQVFNDLYEKEYAFLEQAEDLSDEEIELFIESELNPYYDQIDSITSKILDFTKGKTDSLIDQSEKVLYENIFLTVLFLVLLIAICLLLYKEYNQKMKERGFRNFLFDFLAENIDNVFMIFNVDKSDMEYVFSNSQRVLGIHYSKLREDPALFFDYWDSEEKNEFKDMFTQYNITKRIDKEVQYINPRTNTVSWILFSFQPVQDEEMETRYIISATDLTQTKKNQQALHDALINAQNASNAKSEFLSRMSHEIRTPMNAIIGMTTIAASSINDKNKLEDCLTKISGASKHLLLLINDILDMSKIESGKMSVLKEPFSLVELLKNITSIIYSQAKAKGLDFDVVVQSLNYETLKGDSLRLNQVLLNILSNAIKYTESGGKVKLTVQEVIYKRTNALSLRFIISDTGLGMSPEFLEKLYTPFEQENRNNNSREGSTGIGLAITKNIVTLMGGTITVDSTVGVGSTFVVEIPFDTDSSKKQSFAYNVEFDNLKILVVDDDQDTCEHVTLLLKRMKIEAEWVLLAREAVSKAIAAYENGNSYDVLFIDWKMNDINGVEATRQIRKKVGPDVLIIIISAYDWTEIEGEARLAGANAFISKPMLESTLYNTLITNVKRPFTEITTASVSIKQDLSGKRFLIAEDNEINMEIAIALLESFGATGDAAYDGEEVIDKFQTSSEGYYDVILMDIQMPKKDGYQATREIRKMDRSDAKTIPIIAMTANAFAEDILYSLKAGMNAHISKPIEIDVFYDTIKKCL